jgi:hypothetical protein
LSNSELLNKLSELVSEHLGKRADTKKIVEWLYNSGAFSEKAIIRFLVKSEYIKKTKKQGTNKLQVKYDLMVKYNLSISTINNIIYRYEKIKPIN